MTLHVTHKDRYGPMYAFVQIAGLDVSVELLKAGLARHNTSFSDDETLAEFETKAREDTVGIWSEE